MSRVLSFPTIASHFPGSGKTGKKTGKWEEGGAKSVLPADVGRDGAGQIPPDDGESDRDGDPEPVVSTEDESAMVDMDGESGSAIIPHQQVGSKSSVKGSQGFFFVSKVQLPSFSTNPQWEIGG